MINNMIEQITITQHLVIYFLWYFINQEIQIIILIGLLVAKVIPTKALTISTELVAVMDKTHMSVVFPV
jgi:hypothetical protein